MSLDQIFLDPAADEADAADPRLGARATAGAGLRVLHVTEAPLGGVIAYLEEMLSAQVGMGFDRVEVIAPEINAAALASVSGPNFRLVTYPHRRKDPLAAARLAALTVRRARALRPQIVHVHSTIAGAVVRAIAPLLPRGTRLVYCPHGWAFSREGSSRSNRAIAGVERALARMSDVIVCISDYERREAIAAGIPAARIRVVENGVTPRPAARLRAPAAGPLKIAFVGRFDRQKGFDTYLEVMRRLGDAAQGLVIGKAIVSRDDPTRDLPRNVHILGWQPRERVYQLYNEADLLLVPSRWEGFGLVAIEAMQARLPVFASRVGGLQDVVVDGETGRLFEAGSVDEVVGLIRATTRDELSAFGERGHARFRNRYTAQRMNDRMLGHYRELTGLRPAAPYAEPVLAGGH